MIGLASNDPSHLRIMQVIMITMLLKMVTNNDEGCGDFFRERFKGREEPRVPLRA